MTITRSKRVYYRDRWGRQMLAGHVKKFQGGYIGEPLSPLDAGRYYPTSDAARKYVLSTVERQVR